MKYRYVGPERENCMAYGHDFSNGAVDVTREHALNKLANNPEFEEVKGGQKKASKKEDDGLDELRAKFLEVTGKKAHPAAKEPSMTAAIAEAEAAKIAAE